MAQKWRAKMAHPSVRKRHSFLSIFLMFVPSLSWWNDHFCRKWPKSAFYAPPPIAAPLRAKLSPHNNNATFFEVPLALSRACLGKIGFHESKGLFFHLSLGKFWQRRHHPVALASTKYSATCADPATPSTSQHLSLSERILFFECFPYVCHLRSGACIDEMQRDVCWSSHLLHLHDV